MLGLGEYRAELVTSGRCESTRDRDQEQRHGLGTVGTDRRFDPREHSEAADRAASGTDRLLVGRAAGHAHGEVGCHWMERSRQLLDRRRGTELLDQ
ncbi:MAG TPA: hypothetical protein VK601_04680 [Kofleriaceae bacterium]|nr:hypothetical protein [Kofleriaceae bacterium]